MRFTKALLTCGIVALALAVNSVEARVRVGVSIGVPGPWYPYPNYYYPPPYYYPPVVAVPAAPPTYIQQAPVEQSPQDSGDSYWYYCAGEKAYYPYVKQCPGGWTRVAPKPPSAAR